MKQPRDYTEFKAILTDLRERNKALTDEVTALSSAKDEAATKATAAKQQRAANRVQLDDARVIAVQRHEEALARRNKVRADLKKFHQRYAPMYRQSAVRVGEHNEFTRGVAPFKATQLPDVEEAR